MADYYIVEEVEEGKFVVSEWTIDYKFCIESAVFCKIKGVWCCRRIFENDPDPRTYAEYGKNKKERKLLDSLFFDMGNGWSSFHSPPYLEALNKYEKKFCSLQNLNQVRN